MLKKIVLGSVAAALVGGVVLGTGVWSHVRTAGGWIAQTAEDSMPLEWEVKRARQMISDLEPEIAVNAKRIALEKIKVAKLEKETALANERLADARNDISRLKDDLQAGNQYYTYSGETYTSNQVRDELERRFTAFKTSKETASSLEQMLSARMETLRAASERMAAMMSAKHQLEIEIENLEAQLAAVRAAQTSSELALDDSALSRTRELLDSISARIDVEREMTQVNTEYFGGIKLEDEDSGDLLDEITTYLDSEGVQTGSAEQLAAIRLDDTE
jgi:chromosome segregation ATPase